MPLASVVIGLALAALGTFGYFGSGNQNPSVTALIPAFVGVPIAVCGLLAFDEKKLKHAMHAAAAVGLIGLVLAVVGMAMSLAKGKPVRTEVLAMTGLCALFVGLCVNSFIQARRRRQAQAAATSPAPPA